MPRTFEEFKKKLAEQGGPLPSPWTQPPPPLEEMVPWADPVKRGVATPEMMAEQGQRDELMRNAEFRPANARERKLINLARLLDAIESDVGTKANAFLKRHIKTIGEINKKEMAKGSHISDIIAEKIGKDFPPEKGTPQMEVNLPRNTKESVYPVSYQVPKDVREHNIRARGKIEDSVKKIVSEDFESAGYPEYMIEKVNRDSLRDIGEERFGLHAWDKMNELLTRKKPEHVYHKTTTKKLDSIADKGLIPAEGLQREEINWPKFPEQQDKVFFADRYDTGVGMNVPGSHTTLRTRHNETMNPDIHSPRGWGWWQTQKPIPPSALEIESTPGVWEPLIEYMKKRQK